MKYTIMHKDAPVVSVETDETMLILDTIIHDKPLYDKWVVNVTHWTVSRLPPKGRKHIDQITEVAGAQTYEEKIKTRLLSLHDVMWVRIGDEMPPWGGVNLFDNRFNDVIARVAFSGKTEPLTDSAPSPELSTDGMLPKCWVRKINKISLYKGGTDETLKGVKEGLLTYDNEPFSEFYAYQIAEQMGLEAVSYDIGRHMGQIVSKCPLFTDQKHGYIPAWKLMEGVNEIEMLRTIYKERGWIEYLKDMFVFDAVIYNNDRHALNFGFIRENTTSELLKPAPIFDNGLGLLPYYIIKSKTASQFAKEYTDIAGKYQNKYKEDFIGAIKRYGFLGKRQRDAVGTLLGFKFKRNPSYNLPEKHIEFLEGFVQYNVKRLPYLYF